MSNTDPAKDAISTESKKPRQSLAVLRNRLFQLWRPAATIGFFVLGLFLAWQAWLLREAQTSTQALQKTVEQAVPYIRRPVESDLAKVNDALADPGFVELLGSGSDAEREQAAQQLKGTLRDANDVAIYATDPDALLKTGKGALGYLRASELARAQSQGERQVGVSGKRDDKHRLSIVQPVKKDGKIIAYAAVALPFNAISRSFTSDVYLSTGRIDLRMGPDENGALLVSRGVADRADIDIARQIRGTDIWVTGTRAKRRAWLPDSVPSAPLWVLSLLTLLGAGVISWGERLSRVREMARGKRGSQSEPTFAEVMERGPAPAAQDSAGQKTAATDGDQDQTGPAGGMVVERSIFRAYDIRGIIDKTLDAGVARLLGQAIGSEARDRGQDEIVVGRDGRHSGPMLSSALIEGIRATGIDVIDIGQVPTPLVYFACFQLNTGSGVAVTGSHNPPDYNGFKIVLGGETLAMDAIQGLYARIAENNFKQGMGQLRSMDLSNDYIERIAGDVQAQRQLKVVVDCGNGVTGEIGPRVLEEIGCEVIPLYADIDGDFPNHHPDPSDPANLADLILSVKHQKADLGIAFDGDGDRLGVVTRDGEIIYPDRQLMLFASDVLVRDPGATIIYDVKCTGHLQQLILRQGGSPLMWKTGHSLIKAKMRETGAALAGEMSGHFFFRERWYGFDDGIYAAARLIEILAGDLEERSVEAIFATLPKGVSTPELKIATEEGENHQFVDNFCRKAHFDDARITTIDGLRADWPDGWGLVRASNTTPSLVLRFDADSEDALKRIENVFRKQILAVNPNLKLPF
ncbi:MAG: phosphomannomutase/phosphoglucomutase [Rhodanobacteraceae bacterium]